jgi:hypothetical protein
MEGFTEAERISAAWSKLHAIERRDNSATLKRTTGADSRQYHDKDRDRATDRDRYGRGEGKKKMNRSRSRSKSQTKRNRPRSRSKDASRDVRNRKGEERDKPSYSPYRGNPDVRNSPTYSPYRTSRVASPPPALRRSPERKLTRSRSKSFDGHSSPEELARLPPPPDPRRPDHDNREGDDRRYFSKPYPKDRRSHRSRSRSNERSRDPIAQSAWSHDRFTAADYDR